MTQEYYPILTKAGKAKEMACLAGETEFDIWEIAVGDGNGALYEPEETQTSLKRECWRGLVATCENEGETRYAIVHIPADVGGFTIREIGAFDKTGNLLIIAKCAETVKRLPATGDIKQLSIRLDLSVINKLVLPFLIDPSLNTATVEYCDKHYQQLNQKSKANGYPTLDADALIPENQMPENVISHMLSSSNPHDVTKEQLGLGNVDNTSDIEKPLSNAVQNALTQKADTDLSNISDAGKEVIKENTADKLPLFTQMIFDRVLEGEEALGWALQGTLVTNVYATAVENIKEAYLNGVDTQYRAIACKRATDGRYIADIAQKSAIDALYNSTGVADFYVLDAENNQFYLPKNKKFIEFTTDTDNVNYYTSAGLPNIYGVVSGMEQSASWQDGAFYLGGNTNNNRTKYESGAGYAIGMDASRCSALYGKSNTVQPTSSKRLLYYKVGSTFINKSEIDLANAVEELQLKAYTSMSNLSDEGKEAISVLGKPSSKSISLTLGASGAEYTAPANGYFWISGIGNSTTPGFVFMRCLATNIRMQTPCSNALGLNSSLPVKKGDKVLITYAFFKVESLGFIYDVGSQGDV